MVNRGCFDYSSHKKIPMRRLRSRQMQLPGGLRYIQGETNWRSTPWASFDTIVSEVIAHRQSNPHIINSLGYSIDRNTVENEVEAWNVKMAESMGWLHFLEGGPEVPSTERPFPPGQTPHLLNSLKNVAAGAELLVDWLESKENAERPEVASKRAEICSACPENGKGHLTSYFTLPVAYAIKREIQRRSDWKLSTPFDEQLNICEVCSCPLKLKVFAPLSLILQKISAETKSRLPAHCWIKKEESNA